MNIKKVSCLLHGKEFIGIDTHVFKICCKKCVELDLENRDANLVSNVKENVQHETIDESSEDSGNIVECSKHEGTRGIFFCDDCNEFLCKACFANDHRTHNSNMPKVISNNLKEMLSQLISSLKELNIDETLKNMQELNNRLKSQRKESSVKNSSLQNKIQISLKEKSSLIVSSYYDLFGGLDKESDGVTQRVDAMIKKIHKNINALTEYIKKIEGSQSDQSICMQHKEMKNTLIVIRKFIEDSNHFLKVKILETKDRVQENTSIMLNNLEKFTKNQQIFENSVTSSIISGITSQSIRIRRYVKFDMMCKYYKTSSLIVKLSRAISLVGLGICGLYPMKMIKKVENKSEGSKITKDQKDTKKSSSIFEYIMTTIPISISISEMKNDEISDNKLIEFKHNLQSVINYSDPIITIYFPKALNLKADSKYIITISNNDKNSMYLQIFGGAVPNTSVEIQKQKITCNNSGFSFQFYPAQGIESDFNEFNYGIIADLMYCYVD